MRVVVDPQECEANGVCVSIAPEIFELDDNDVLHIHIAEPTGDLAKLAVSAVDRCPKRALYLHDN